ncbi:MAG: glycosyltransferase [Candidatus Competibacteraceae bacterium]|jgi:GT2 family glycosyltransferase|nr:glycosyltransferase [Candidatus Competibacteraceae bacterium]
MKPAQKNICDIVLPIHNGLTYVKDCIESLIQHTPAAQYPIYIIDDASDSTTSDYLNKQETLHSQIILRRNPNNLGFLKSCNIGIYLGTAPYVVLVNSDVIATPCWLERLIECMESDPKIATVNPLTNSAAQIDLSMPPGANFFAVDEYLEQHSPKHWPDIVTGVGFCLLLRRAALEEVGVFDEIYGRGYCEESDLCMRLTARGYRTVIADHVYVYHKGGGTFSDSDERYRRNRRLFDSRWAREYKRQFRAFQKADPLAESRALFSLPRRWDPMPVIWQTARALLDGWQEKAFLLMALNVVRGLRRLPKAKRELATPASVTILTRPNRLRVTYLLHHLVISGGVLSVIQLVNELILLGVEARIVALYEDPAVYAWSKLFTRPIIFCNEQELVQNCPDSDIIVATLWNTVPWAVEVAKQNRAKHTVYFIQDYEPWFFPDSDAKKREQVKSTYGQIKHHVVMSDWLNDLLMQDGFSATKIALGMDLGRFYPRSVPRSQPIVLAMARPGTPRRGYPSTIAALCQLKKLMPEVEIVLFGDRFLSYRTIPFSYRDEGIVFDQNRLATLYSEADVFLDGSDFQGFGRCALEAMACGTACVLTEVGGVMEYARNGENALLVPPRKPSAFVAGIKAILDDEALKNRLVEGGLATAEQYCHKREADETLAYFLRLSQQ